jgi:hypothetical protein
VDLLRDSCISERFSSRQYQRVCPLTYPKDENGIHQIFIAYDVCITATYKDQSAILELLIDQKQIVTISLDFNERQVR